MAQHLSAMRYIKNNKRRVAVLIVSLALCFMLTYITQFVLSVTEETFLVVGVEGPKRMQFIELAGSSYGIDVENTEYDEILRQYDERRSELIEKLKKHEGVKDVRNAEILWGLITALIGNWSFEIPLVDTAEDAKMIMEHFGAELKEGRMPESAGEIILDEATMKNNDYVLNGYFDEKDCGTAFKIVGVLECDRYFGCGISNPEFMLSTRIMVLSEGIDDMSAELFKEGIIVRDTYDSIVDCKTGREAIKRDVTDVISTSISLIYIGIMILLSISLFIVYTMYLRDRRDEWCLYSSIGYSRKTIYFSILRELLFTFITALIIGGVLILFSELIINLAMIQPKGLKCRYFYPKTIGEILCSYALLLGVLQIPVRLALYKIRTIDAMDDDLY